MQRNVSERAVRCPMSSRISQFLITVYYRVIRYLGTRPGSLACTRVPVG